MQSHRRTSRHLAVGAAALAALGAAAAGAQGAVTSSTYAVDQVRQTSRIVARSSGAAGTFDYRANASFTFRGRRARDRFVVDHTRRAFAVGLTRRAGSGLRFADLSWTPSGDGQQTRTCDVARELVPATERSFSLLIVPPSKSTSRRLQIDIQGPNALDELSKGVRTARCQTPIPTAKQPRGLPPAGKRRPDFDSLTFPRNKLVKRHVGAARKVVLTGKKRTPLVVGNGVRIGSITVTTTIRLRLVGSTGT